MQNLISSGTDPVTTAIIEKHLNTKLEALAAQSEPDAQEEESKPVSATDIDTPMAQQENGTPAEAPTSTAIAPAENETAVPPLTQPSDNTERMDSASKSNSTINPRPKINSTPGFDVQKAKNQNKVDGRKYVPSKKAMVDPLKIDMSKPTAIPVTSSQLSLQCTECHIIFCDHKSKVRHMKLSHPAEYEQCILRNALFACYVCDRHFTNSTELMAHQKAHTEKEPFKCPICGQAFKRSSELTHHKKNHFGSDGYPCIDCGKPCKTTTSLNYHRRTHTRERPYVCKECGRRFSVSKALQKHMVSHLPEGAEAEMQRKAQMKKEDGPTIKYPCSICKATFKTTKTRLQHMKTKHKALLAANSNGISAGQQVKLSTPIITPISICQPALLQLEPNGPLQKVDANIDTEQICRLIESLGNVQKVNQVVVLGQVPPHAPPLEVQQTSHLGEPGNLNPKQLQIDCLELKKMESKTVELTPSNKICDSMEQTIILEPITPDGQLENPSFSGVGSQIAAGENMGLKQIQSKTVELNPSNNICSSMEQIIILEPIAPDGQLENPAFSGVGSEIGTGVNMELKQTESKTDEIEASNKESDSMEQTIVLEPIMPDEQLENPAFSGVGSHVAADENIIRSEQTIQHGGEVIHEAQPHSIDLENMEQTVILELTPALIPTVELEQSQTVPQNEPPSCVLVPTTEVEKNPGQPVEAEQENTLAVSPLSHTADLKLSSLQAEQEELPPCPSVPLDALTQIPDESDTNPIEGSDLQKQRVCLDQVQPLLNGAKTQGNTEQEASERVQAGRKEGQEQVENLSEVQDPSAKEAVLSQLETKQVPQSSQIPLNAMSAQELVKVRKRKPARGHFFQEYIHELVGSIYKDDLCINAKPAKRQRTKESHLVKFASQSKEKKKERKSSQQRKRTQEDGIASKAPTTNLSDKKRSPKKGKKGEMDKKAGHLVSAGGKKSPSPIQEPLLKQKNHPRKNKMKQQKEVATECVTCVSEHKTVDSPEFPKAKKAKIVKVQPKNAKVVKSTKTRVEEEEKTRSASTDTPGSHVTQNALLLLKGHKQPQLKVYKLDTSAASGHTPETSPKDSKTLGKTNRHSKSESTIDHTSEDEKKGGRPKKNQKALLLSSLKDSHQPPEILPTKPKTTRKRKASSKVETEGVITSHSKRALECNECGERFSEVSTLQNHKATLHIIESPGLTYTNGNVFEGVTSLALYQLPKKDPRVGGMMNAASGWDTEPEIGEMALDDRETSVSFPALIPSPSLPVPPSDVERNDCEDTGPSKIRTGLPAPDQIKNHETHQSFETTKPFTSVGNTGEASTPRNPTTEAEVHGTVDEDIKEDLLLEVDLVTVGEQSENDHPTSNDTIPQKESNGTCNSETESLRQVSDEAENSQTSQTVLCLPHQIDIKEEEEEIFVQKIKGAGMRNVTRRRRTDDHCDVVSKKKALARKAVRETQLEKDQQECEVVYEQHTLSSDSEINDESDAGTKKSKPETTEANKTSAPGKSSPSVPSKLEESAENQVVELKAFNTSMEEVRDDSRLRREEQTKDQFPGILTEKFLTSRQQTTPDEELCQTEMNSQKEVLDATAENEVHIVGSHAIKVEENVSYPQQVAASCQNRQNTFVQPQCHLDIRAVLVKEENNLVLNEVQATPGSRHIRWNVEPVSNENTSTPFPEHAESSRDCRLTPLFSTSQCIFYPVKEEERELPLGISETNCANLTTGTTISALQTECQTTDSSFADEESHSAVDNERMGLPSEPRVIDFTEGQAEVDADWQQPQDLQDLLLQSSEEEDVGSFELSDPQLDSEAEIMAYFDKNQTSNRQHSDEVSTNLPTSTSQLQTPRVENITKEPIVYFSKYFGWDAWVEIANCTITSSNMPKPVTAREVAQFVGIHIAMGTLKFPSPKLYWEELTKVPLIAESMPQARFLELCRVLRFASPPEDSVHSSVQERHDSGFQNVPQDKNPSSSQNALSQQGQKDALNDTNGPKTQSDPLWKVQPLLGRFKAGCQSLRRDGDYAVDQYPLPLTGKLHSKKHSLCCTTLIGLGGFLLHVDLKSGLSSKEDAVENLVPRGSMVFLCKQELSTPAVLERLLVAGVHGAGKVGGARGQIGDEFISSDGKLMLRRSQCGFILSTAGNSQKNMASLTDNFEKAQMSAHVNRDLRNLYSTPITASSPTCWPQVVLWYLTDLALINSWLLYRQDHRAASAPLSLMAFRLEVSKALILSRGCDAQDSVPPQSPIKKTHAAKETPSTNLAEESPLPDAATQYDGLGHWPEQLGEGEGGRCRFRDCQRTSRVLCLKCCVFLCISRNNNCFLKFHEGSAEKE